MATRSKDYAEQETDKLLEKVEKKIVKEYSTALKEIKEEYAKFTSSFEKEEEEKTKEYNAGKISYDDLVKWRENKLLTSKHYRQMIDVMTEDLVKADQKAASIVNGYMPEAYALNFNFASYDIEQNTQLNASFTLYSRESVEKLAKKNPQLLPKSKVDIPKDQRWQRKHLNSAIFQGILQGKSIPKIADSLQQVTDMDRRAAIRNARTMMTGAQNGGRMAAYERAADLGIKIEKEWMATLDSRTRDSHAELDGQRVSYKKAFSNGLQYPGDPSGAPEEVYNCRCTMVPYYPEYADVIKNRMTYSEWAKSKDGIHIDHMAWISKVYNDVYEEKNLEEIAELYSKAPEEVQKVFEKFGKEMNVIEHGSTSSKKLANFDAYHEKVYLNCKKDIKAKEGDTYIKYELSSHELGHYIDFLAGRNKERHKDLTALYKNKDGKSFIDIINKDIDNIFKKLYGANVEDTYEKSFIEKAVSYGWGAPSTLSNAITKVFEKEYGSLGYLEKAKKDNKYSKMLDKLEIISNLSFNERRSNDNIDEYLAFYVENKDFFSKVFETEKVEVTSKMIFDFCDKIKNEYDFISRKDFSDIFENYSIQHGGPKYPFGTGHGGSAYTADEAFAEMISASVANGDSLEVIKEYLPNAYDTFLDMLKEAVK